MLELLVEQVPQAPQLVGVAQLIGLDDLIRRDAEGAVDRVLVGSAARLGAWAAGPLAPLSAWFSLSCSSPSPWLSSDEESSISPRSISRSWISRRVTRA